MAGLEQHDGNEHREWQADVFLPAEHLARSQWHTRGQGAEPRGAENNAHEDDKIDRLIRHHLAGGILQQCGQHTQGKALPPVLERQQSEDEHNHQCDF